MARSRDMGRSHETEVRILKEAIRESR
jgi:hypothetical protein